MTGRGDPAGRPYETCEDMDRKSRFPVRKFESLEAMKDEEYRYWQGRPASERMAAVSGITTEAYRLKDPACNLSRLQRTLVAVQRNPGAE